MTRTSQAALMVVGLAAVWLRSTELGSLLNVTTGGLGFVAMIVSLDPVDQPLLGFIRNIVCTCTLFVFCIHAPVPLVALAMIVGGLMFTGVLAQQEFKKLGLPGRKDGPP